jgi:hypothetical protein
MAKELLEAWFEPAQTRQGDDGVRRLAAVDERHRR